MNLLKVRLLMWKSFVEKKRSWITLIGQLWGPIAMCFLLITFYEAILSRDYGGYLEELFMPAALIIVIPTVTTTVVAEKSTRLMESMKMMGLKETAYYTNLVLVEGILFGVLMGGVVGGMAKLPNAFDDINYQEDGTSAEELGPPGLFYNADFIYVFLSIFIFCVCSVPFGFLISVFFDSPKFAGQVSFFACLALILFNMSYDIRKNGGKVPTLIASAFPPLGYSMYLKVLNEDIFCEWNDCTDEDTTWDNLDSYGLVDKSEVAVAMLFGAVVFSVLAWYLRNVMPSEYGVPKKWNFCFRCDFSTWPCCRRRLSEKEKRVNKHAADMAKQKTHMGDANPDPFDRSDSRWAPSEEEEANAKVAEAGDPEAGDGENLVVQVKSNGKWCDATVLHKHGDGRFTCRRLTDGKIGRLISPDLVRPKNRACMDVTSDFEPIPASLNDSRSVRVRSLRKTFHGGEGKLVAVNDISFDLVQGQVFSLLGHNGAGKTTTISMLTGLIPPDPGHGRTTVYGHCIAENLDEIRTVLGICPQHDTLMPALTTWEHIIFFAMLKGSTYRAAKEEAMHMLVRFNLLERRDHFGSGLSGGMRRKLSTILALCGGSKFCILDEPSSGMDPLARHELWDSINACKRDRTILLTTHYMDEADQLGDRIGIMSHGVMQTIGSSSFLKRRFGCGYVLECEKVDPETDNSEIVDFVTSKLENAIFNKRESYERQLFFELPFESVGKFGKFFQEFDEALEILGLTEYGISITSMEDVFLEVGRDGRKQKRRMSAMRRKSESPSSKYSECDNDAGGLKKSAIRLGVENQKRASLKKQAFTMVRKRLWMGRNDYVRTLVMILMPCIVFFAVFLLNSQELLNDDADIGDAMTSYIVAVGAFIFLPGLIAAELVRERASKLRYTLSVMGAKQYAYFLGMFLGDYCGWLIITVVSCLIAVGIGGIKYMDYGGVLVLMPLFGVQLISFSYCVSFLFKRPTFAIIATPMILLLLAFLSQVIVGIALMASGLNSQDKEEDSDYVEPFALFAWGVTIFCPLGTLGTGLLMTVVDITDYADQYPHIGAVYAMMLLYSALFMALAIRFDSKSLLKIFPTFEDDATVAELRKAMHTDVLNEAKKVDRTSANDVALQLKQLRKVYPKRGPTPETVAVKGISLQVEKRSILCLLGPNGAGKSTTLNMLLRAVTPTSGDASVTGHSMLSDFERGAVALGVVPQDNNLWPLLTCEQHLRLFAMLRGVPKRETKSVVDSALMHMELASKAKTLSKNLSGGMQRRLCTAIALIGNPDVVLLDEPSAGLDPVSRRNLWDVIRETMGERAVILTTHSMEEADALATRIAIMAYGSLLCVGTGSHLKKTLGSDFEVVVKLKHEMVPMIDQGAGGSSFDATSQVICTVPQDIQSFMTRVFKQYSVISASGDTCVFTVKKENVVIGRSFAAFHTNMERLDIEDFSISQPTLEQVFIKTVLDAKNDRLNGGKGDIPDDEDANVIVLGDRIVDRRSIEERRTSSFRSMDDLEEGLIGSKSDEGEGLRPPPGIEMKPMAKT